MWVSLSFVSLSSQPGSSGSKIRPDPCANVGSSPFSVMLLGTWQRYTGPPPFLHGGVFWPSCSCQTAHCTAAAEESQLSVFELCTITDYEVMKTTCLDILLSMVFIYYYREQFKGLSCCVPSGRPVCPSAFLSAFIHIRHFDRLMKRTIKHCCVTQRLTLIIITVSSHYSIIMFLVLTQIV